jgi:hypothetical protein
VGRRISFYFQAKMDEHLVQGTIVGKRQASCGFCGIRQLQLTLGELMWTT